MKKNLLISLIAAIVLITASATVLAVTNPLLGTSAGNGRFVYVPDMTRERIRVVDANLVTGMVDITPDATAGNVNDSAVVQNVSVAGLRPYSMLVNSAGTVLYAVLSQNGASPYVSHIRAYSIAANGTLSQIGDLALETYASPRGAAITASGNYLYVADQWSFSGNRKIRRINISNPAAMTEGTATLVSGSNMNLYGVAISLNGNRLYISVDHSATGQVLVYNIATETNPVLVSAPSMGSGTCPQASFMLVSPDNTKLFVKVLQTASPYADIKVFNTVGDAYTLIANITKPTPGDHSIAGYDPATGYAAGHQDADYANDNAGLAFSPDGQSILFTHYVGTSGSGTWHWNVKAYSVSLDDYTNIYEANSGVGFHSADSLVFTPRNRIWMLYSDGGSIQTTPQLGPLWTSHYNATSREAVVKWADTPYASTFDIQYQRIWPTLSTISTIFAVAAPTSEYTFLPILDHNVSYEVRVRTNTPNGEISLWTPNSYVAGHNLYTLEPVWTSFYNTYNTGATILFGPVKSTDVKDVPFATSYQLYFRQVGTSPWVIIPVNLGSADDATNVINNTRILSGLSPNVQYEFIMRSVDSNAMASEWSMISTFETVDTPWVGSFAPKRTMSGIEWGGPNLALNITDAVSYELQSRIWTQGNTNSFVTVNKYLSTSSKEADPIRGTLNVLFSGLTERTTYEVRLRANLSGGTQTAWSNTAQFFTWWVYDDNATMEVGGPSWVSHYKVASNEAVLMCELANKASTTNYAFQYRVLGSSVWTTASPAMFNWASRYDVTNNFPNIHITGLTPATTYEAKVRAYDSVSDTWSDWSSSHTFYTLEKCWVDWYLNAASTGAYITWGPEVKPAVNVWGALGYKWRYSVNGASWVVSSETLGLSRRDDPAKQAATDALSFRFLPLVSSATYSVEVAAINGSGILGEWSTTAVIVVDSGPTVHLPWMSTYGTTPESTVAIWGWIGSNEPAGIDHYELTYSTNEGISWQTYSGPSTPLPGTTKSFLWSGLTPLITYEARIRAVNASGVQMGNQSAIYTFHTYWQPWLDHLYLQNTKTTMIWGPQAMPTSELGSYLIQYKRAVDTAWTNYSGPSTLPLNNLTFAISESVVPNLNVSFESLTAHTTYEVRVRAIHTSGFLGDWSTIDLFKTTQGPWWTAAEILSTTSARFFWDNTPMATLSALSYRVSYGTDAAAISSGESTVTNAQLTMESLVPGATYYAKVRAAYSGGNYSDWTEIRAITIDAFSQGPTWANTYLVSSREAYMDWQGYTTVPVTYTISYRVQGGAWTDIAGLPVSQSDWTLDTNPNYKLGIVNLGSYLSPLTTYEVRTKWVRTSDGVSSSWTPTNTFFTFERPWTDTFKPSNTSVYLTWGPEVSTTDANVPLSTGYQGYYRIDTGSGFGAWTLFAPTGTIDPVSGKLQYLWSGLTANATYEYTLASVAVPGGISNPSDVKTLHSIRGPWWIDAINIDYTSATMIWENVAGVTNYELQVTTDATFAGTPITTVSGATTYNKTGLTQFTTYYTRVRAITSGGGGNRSDWSPTKSFFTIRGPRWISNYLTSSTQTSATWEGVTVPGLTYEVNYRVSNEANPWTFWASSPVNQHYSGGIISGLALRTWYDLRVRSIENNFASAWSSVDQFYTLPSPNNVDWTGSTATTVSLTWEPVDLGTGTTCGSYEISWGLTPEAVGVGLAMSADPWYVMTGLTDGTTYYVKVRAHDDANGGWSDWAPYNPATGQTSLVVVATNNVIINGVSAGFGITSGYRGTTVIISGMNFGSVQGTGTVAFGGTPAQVGYWKNTEIAVAVPQAAVTGVNSITVVANSGSTATHVPSPYTFTVTDGGLVFDDIEGGTWQFVTWEVGSVANVTSTKAYIGAPERDTYNVVSITGNAAYEIAGGVTPYGALATQNGFDLSQQKVITLWFKGDGSSNIATFELVEANTSPGNLTSNPLAAEVWKYSVPISLSDTSWHQITITLTDDAAATDKFVRDTSWWSGNNALDLSKIKSYQIITSGGNPKSYSYDYGTAYVTDPANSTVTNEVIERVADAVGSGIRISWASTGIPINADIYTLTGTFDVNPIYWTKQYSNISATTQLDNTTVGDGVIKWFKVVKAGTVLTSGVISNGVLGKWDYVINIGDNLISLPFVPTNTDINVVIGNQLTAGTFFTADKIVTLLNDSWVTSRLINTTNQWSTTQLGSFEPDRGYWVTASATKTVTVVGKTTNVARVISLAGATFNSNLVGTCYPIPVLLNSSDLAPLLTAASYFNSDKVYEYTGVWTNAYRSPVSPVFKGQLTYFVPGRGYTVSKQAAGTVTWTYPKTY